MLRAPDSPPKDGKFRLLVLTRPAFQQLAWEEGFAATPRSEFDAAFPLGLSEHPVSAGGFGAAGADEGFDVEKYGQVLWKGFNHELNGEGPLDLSEEKRDQLNAEMFRPHVDLSLKIAVIAPNGEYAAYCGMWWDPASPDALVEPVATDPAYRRLGLGRAAVLEGVKRCGLRGAKRALVGSSQAFYYSIGFRPLNTYTWWKERRGITGTGRTLKYVGRFHPPSPLARTLRPQFAMVVLCVTTFLEDFLAHWAVSSLHPARRALASAPLTHPFFTVTAPHVFHRTRDPAGEVHIDHRILER